MRPTVTRGNIRVAGAVDNSPIGLLDEPVLPQHGGTNHVVFYPFSPTIGTTTIVQRLCGSDPTNPNPSSGINGYRAVWSIELDSVGTIRYENFFLWDISYDSIENSDLGETSLQSARVVVLLIPVEDRSKIQELISWYQGHIQDSQRVIVVVTRCDRVESAQIRPSDVDNLSATLNVAVVQVSGANVTPSARYALHPSLRKLVLAIADNLPQRV
ncbi:hypothetical protein TRFO_36491 [Tritrichomonas foetus]|uniref:Uncharacterized protein n=1 Tax=Tritrichomonas foetus TaxID=1144522 RepID=A0A1J4JDR1_9EUKA|nr:hypothetical protein TRFO_36491 [Tritrichomonas foetus]|eukprot:OHS97334.1 hypothetical protein TRFO_36491 [Tritrichomonas foetus]